jgi:beta-lactamase regulating signal transducer with metallopeptidase domain
MNPEALQILSGWAWRTSLEALPLAIVATLIWRWRSLPVSWRWWLPALFFLRLAMPGVPEADWHAWSLANPRANSSFGRANHPDDTNGNSTHSRASRAVPSGFADEIASVPWRRLLPPIWAGGCLTVVAWILISQWRLRRGITRYAIEVNRDLVQHSHWAAARMGLSRCIPMRAMPGWSTMAVQGWWRPTLLIPADLSERFSVAQIRGMLLHEMAHVRRRDVLWTWLALGLCALHWFNPLAWLALRRFHAARELACDAAALRALEPAARQDYGEALLLCLQGSPASTAPALAPFFRRFPELKQRLQNIMKPNTPTLWSRLITALLVPTLTLVTFTTARAQRDGDAPKPGTPEAAERPLRDGEKPKVEKRDAEGGKEKARGGEGEKPVARDGDQPRKSPREGEMKRNAERDGDGAHKTGPRDGDQPKKGLRDGDQPRKGPRDGEVKKAGARDGEQPRAGARDGDAPKAGPRDGDQPRKGPRDGEGVKAEARDGDAPKAGPRDGDGAKPEGAKPDAR